MKKYLNKILLLAGVVAVLLALRFVYHAGSSKEQESLKGSQTLGATYGLYNGLPMTATSTPRTTAEGTNWYVEENNAFNLGKTDETLTGTTSVIISTGGADMLDINAFFVGSTTDAYLTWDYEFSNDGIGWFAATLFSDQADFQTRVGTSTYSNEGFTLEGTTTPNIQINPMGSRFVRLNLGSKGSTGVATGTLWIEVIKRNNN